MNVLLHQVLSGLATGGIYASMALALVMIYQATHLVNFAQGEMAMFATYIAWSLMQAGLPYWLAFIATVAIAFAMGALIERVIVRPVEQSSVLSVVIVFIGLLVIFNSLAGWIFSYTIKPFPSPFPAQPLWGNTYVTSHELGAIGVTLVVLALVFAFFRFTWSLRQYTFGAILVGATPEHKALGDDPARRSEFADRAGRVLGLAAETFNDGLRAYYFAFALVAWFVSPWAFMAATALVVFVLYRREFHSEVLRMLRHGQ